MAGATFRDSAPVSSWHVQHLVILLAFFRAGAAFGDFVLAVFVAGAAFGDSALAVFASVTAWGADRKQNVRTPIQRSINSDQCV